MIKSVKIFPKFEFKTPLIEGLIKSRPNRFIMNVEINGNVEKCHCPTTGKVGNIIFKDVQCLLSKSENSSRKTSYTVEAFFNEENKTLVGINQTAINRYVEHFLKFGLFNPSNEKVQREQTIGSSRLDFRVGNTYIEVKMPLFYLFADSESLEAQAPTALERFIKHVNELGNSLENNRIHGSNNRAILLTCFMFDSPKFTPPKQTKQNTKVVETIKKSMGKGIEIWQLNLSIDKFGVNFIRNFEIISR
jgi:sugar fermentation stimulation protein A